MQELKRGKTQFGILGLYDSENPARIKYCAQLQTQFRLLFPFINVDSNGKNVLAKVDSRRYRSVETMFLRNYDRSSNKVLLFHHFVWTDITLCEIQYAVWCWNQSERKQDIALKWWPYYAPNLEICILWFLYLVFRRIQ